MEVGQGRVSDRPFARTIYTVSAQRFTGDLILREGERRYKLSWEDGRVVAAESAAPADSAGRVALAAGLVTSTDLSRAFDAIASSPDADPLAVLSDLARLKPDQVVSLKRRLLAQRAARAFALPQAVYVLDNARSLRADPHVPPLDARWLVYFGVRTHYTVDRLERELGALIDRGFKLADDALPGLPAFAFGDGERPVMDRLALHAWTPRQLIAACGEIEAQLVLSVVYALVACDCLEPGVVPDTVLTSMTSHLAAIARGTESRGSANTGAPPPADGSGQQARRARPNSTSFPAPAVPGAAEHARLAHGTVRRLLFPGHVTSPPPAGSESTTAARGRRASSRPPITGITQPIPTQPLPPPPPAPGADDPPRSSSTNLRPQTIAPQQQAAASPPRARPVSTQPPPRRTSTAPPPLRPHSTTVPPILRRIHNTTIPPDGRQAAAEIRRMVQEKVVILNRNVDHYAILGVKQSATPDEIRAAYFSIAKRIHPDRLVAIGVNDIGSDAQRLFARINLAFGVLSDPQRRAEYSMMMAAGGEEAVRKAQAEAGDKATRVLRAEETFRLGEMALRRNQFDQARVLFEEAVGLNPEEAEYHALFAWATWLAAPNKQQVATDVQKRLAQALALSPSCVPAHFYGAQVAKHSGQLQAAMDAFRKVVDLDPGHSEASLELRLLRGRLRKK